MNDEPEVKPELRQKMIEAVLGVLRAEGWQVTENNPGFQVEHDIIRRGDEQLWLSFGLELQGVKEPELGTIVHFLENGGERSGPVTYRYPGGVRATWQHKGHKDDVVKMNGEYRVHCQDWPRCEDCGGEVRGRPYTHYCEVA